MSCLMGITADGVPLFVRSYHGMKQLPFPAVGSLSGVHMYGLNSDFVLRGMSTEGGCVAWKLFKEKLLLVVAFEREKKPDQLLQFILDQVFDAIVLTIGINEVSWDEVGRGGGMTLLGGRLTNSMHVGLFRGTIRLSYTRPLSD